MPGSGSSFLTKTVYNPNVYSDSVMTAFANEAGQRAAYSFSQGIPFDLAQNNAYLIEVGGITWEVPISNFTETTSTGLKISNPYIPTAYPHRVQGGP